jgi:PST family polysaccharide transporter
MFAQAFIMFFNLVVEYGFILSATKDISVHRNDKNKITEIFSSVLTIQVVLVFITFLLLNLIIYNVNRFSSDITLYNLTFLMVVGQVLFPVWYFQGMERMKYITIVNIISKVLFTILIFVVIQNESDYIYVPLLNGLGTIVGAIISLFIIYKHFNQKFKLYNINTLIKYLKDSTQYFISRIANAGNYYYLIVIIGIMYGNTITGYFSMVERLYKAYYMGIQPLVQVIYPNMAKNKSFSFFKKIYFPTVIFFAIVSILLIIFSNQFLLLFYGISSDILNNIFYILFASTFFGITNILIGYPLLGAMGYVKKANYGNIYGALVSFAYTTICYFLGVDILVIVFSLLISEIVGMLYRGYFVNKYIIKIN